MALIGGRNVPQPPGQSPSWWIKKDLTDEEALALCDQYYDMQKTDLVKHAFERMWYIAVLFLLGYQMVPKPGMGGINTINTASFPNRKRRYIANRLLPMLMRQVSRMTSSPINWDVVPNSPDTADQRAAAVARSLLFAVQKQVGLEDARNEAAFWTAACGTSFIKVEWDDWADGSKRIYVNPLNIDPASGQPTVLPAEKLDEGQRQFLDRQKWFVDMPSGDVRVRALSPFETVVPVIASRNSMLSAPWWMHVRQESADYCFNRFEPKRLKEVRPDRDMSLSNYYQRRLKTIIAMFGYFTGFEERDEKEELITIRELWIPPSKRMPNGRLIVCSRDHVLVNMPHPLKDQRIKYPVAKWDYSKIGDRFWSKGMVEDMLYPQSELNRTRTTAHQIRDLMGQPKWTYEKGSGINFITSEPGQNVVRNRGYAAPVVMQATTDHAMHENIALHLKEDLNDLAAQSDATQAKNPPGVRSGIALQALQEKDDTVLAPTVHSGEQCMETSGSLTLKFIAKNYKEYRLIAIHGQDRATDVLYFRGSDLRNHDRVAIRAGSLMPKSQAATAEKTLEMVQLGVLDPTNPADKRVIAKAMNFGEMDSQFALLMAHERRADDENERFRSTDPDVRMPVVKPWDDHMVHMERHNLFRTSDTYEMLPPQIQEAVDAHCAVHEEMIAKMMAMQQEQTMTEKGAPGEKGEASQPSKKTSGAPGKPKEAAVA